MINSARDAPPIPRSRQLATAGGPNRRRLPYSNSARFLLPSRALEAIAPEPPSTLMVAMASPIFVRDNQDADRDDAWKFLPDFRGGAFLPAQFTTDPLYQSAGQFSDSNPHGLRSPLPDQNGKGVFGNVRKVARKKANEYS